MPGALSEVGSITLLDEHDLLASPAGQDAVAAGLFEGLAAYLGSRELAGRIALEGEVPGDRPPAVEGDGPPFRAAAIEPGPLRLRITNTGVASWPEGMSLVAAWEETDLPYLPQPPTGLVTLGGEVPDLAPGESAVIEVELPPAPGGQAVAWIGLRSGTDLLADAGSPPLQLGSEPD
jgi:hypothetical protein